MDDPADVKLPNEAHIASRLAGAREQLTLVVEALRTGRPLLAESATCSVIDQALKALTAALHGFNVLLPQPLPPERVTCRNLRARFVAVQAESTVLDMVEEHLRPRVGWLWWLDRKEHASAFASLLRFDETGSAAIWRDPLDPMAGVEAESPDAYLRSVLDRIEQLTREIARLARRDAEVFRQAARRQPGRML